MQLLRPFCQGRKITLTASVKDAAKKPVEGAEVTLYAVDEGVLSLNNLFTPTPFEFFMRLLLWPSPATPRWTAC
ncbi:MAG: hypothetical protein QM796_21360 [Chthoniobacteraceae bacterium]